MSTSKQPTKVTPTYDYQHSFELARVCITEEHKTFAAKTIKLIDQCRPALEVAQSAADIGEDTRSKLSQLLKNLDQPVEEHVLLDINRSLDAKGRDDFMHPEDIKRLYGVPDATKYAKLLSVLNHSNFEEWSEQMLTEMDGISATLNQVIADRGGDSDQALTDVSSKYRVDRDSSWHREYFGMIETSCHAHILNILAEEFRISPTRLVTEDLGCGTGRCLHQLAELLAKGLTRRENKLDLSSVENFPWHEDEEIAEFVKNYHGVDISEQNVKETLMLARGIMEGHCPGEAPIKVGDFHDVEGGPAPGTVHYAFSMMRTSFHNITEDQLVSYLRRIERDLVAGTEGRHGGLALLDFVDLKRIHPEYREGDKVEPFLHDLKNLYTQLFRVYAEKYQHLMPPGINLKDMPRHPICDNTTGQGFYWREVLSMEYVEYLIDKYKIDLEQKISTHIDNPKAKAIKDNLKEREKAIKLGRKWIEENGLLEYYVQQIQDRLTRGIIDSKTLDEIVGYSESNDINDNTEAILNYLAYQMVKGFGSLYFVLQRPMKEVKEAAA